MRIGIDGRPIQGRFTGDCTYWRGLIGGLSRLGSDDEFFIYLDPKLPRPEVPASENLRVRYLRSISWRAWSAWAFPRALREDGIHVAHVQYTIPPGVPCPVVTSIHDVSFKRHIEFFPLTDRLILDMGVKRSAKRASRILAISSYTKRELLELYRIPPAKITVIYPGVDKQFRPMDMEAARQVIGEKYGIRSPFVLTVGVIQPRKNLQRLLEAFAKFKGVWQSVHQLIIAGKYGWMETGLERRIERLGLVGDVVLTGYVPYEDLPAFYSAADVFVYPSVYEGFGLPPLEAMACGTPVITGDRTSLPEVVGDAGMMVDPHDVDALAGAILRVSSSDSLRAEMSAESLKQAGKFSWDDMARQVAAIYHEAARHVYPREY